MSADWPRVPLGEVLSLREPDVEVSPDQEYRFAGVYCFGRGAFVGQKKLGREFSYPRLTRLRASDFLYPKLMAWEGAYSLVPPECEGLVVSTEFPVFGVDQNRLLPPFLGLYFKRASVWPELGSESTGTNVRRRRLNPADFLRYRFPLPPLAEQRRIVARVEAVSARIAEAQRLREEASEDGDRLLIQMAHRANLSDTEKQASKRLAPGHTRRGSDADR
jgi:type I restriction enzyme S subunit